MNFIEVVFGIQTELETEPQVYAHSAGGWNSNKIEALRIASPS